MKLYHVVNFFCGRKIFINYQAGSSMKCHTSPPPNPAPYPNPARLTPPLTPHAPWVRGCSPAIIWDSKAQRFGGSLNYLVWVPAEVIFVFRLKCVKFWIS